MIQVQATKQLGRFQIEAAFSSDGIGITTLLGYSGSGKTSLLNMVAGLLTPDTGRVVVNDKILFDSNKRINVPAHKRRIGYVFQDKRLFPFLSVRNNLMFACPDRKDPDKLNEVVKLLGVAHLLDRTPMFLSGGEAQRVAIGRALLSDPELLLLDEPLSSLDSDRRDELIPYIKRIPETMNIPIVLVTHSRDEVQQLADSVVHLENGKVACLDRLQPKKVVNYKRSNKQEIPHPYTLKGAV